MSDSNKSKPGPDFNEFEGCDGCSTGDCPHSNVNDCVQAQAKIIAEQAAEIVQLREAMGAFINAKRSEHLCVRLNDDEMAAVELMRAALAPATEKGQS